MRLQKIEARLGIQLAITQEQFDKWPNREKQAWIREHPNSKFAKPEKDSTRDLQIKATKILIRSLEGSIQSIEPRAKLLKARLDFAKSESEKQEIIKRAQQLLKKNESLKAKLEKQKRYLSSLMH